MPPLQMMLKPVSGDCNMRCAYCFYRDIAENRGVRSFGRMSEDTLAAVIEKALGHATGDCSFAFQGGEPTLAGLEFFRKVVELQKKYNTKKLPIHNAIQTNGLAMNEEWAAFFAEHHFLVGLSVDGAKELHDSQRLDAQRKGTHSRVMQAARLLEKAGAEFNVLCVVTRQTARNCVKTYRFFKNSGMRYLQFIPCLDGISEERGCHPYSLKPEDYARFLKTLFDLWFEDLRKNDYVYVRYFENLAGILNGEMPESCTLRGTCTVQYVVEADGGVYPCDFYMMDGYRLGNLITDGFGALEKRRAGLRFIEQSQEFSENCKGCEWFALCRGGCRRDRVGTDAGAGNYYCGSYREFFAYAYPRLRLIRK